MARNVRPEVLDVNLHGSACRRVSTPRCAPPRHEGSLQTRWRGSNISPYHYDVRPGPGWFRTRPGYACRAARCLPRPGRQSHRNWSCGLRVACDGPISKSLLRRPAVEPRGSRWSSPWQHQPTPDLPVGEGGQSRRERGPEVLTSSGRRAPPRRRLFRGPPEHSLSNRAEAGEPMPLTIRPHRFPGAGNIASILALTAGAVVGALSVNRSSGTSAGVWVAILGAALTALGLLGLAARRHGWKTALISPLGITVLLIVCLFLLRPAAIALDPKTAMPGLAVLGFTWANLSWAVGFGTLAFGLFGVAYLLPWRPRQPAADPEAPLPADRRLQAGLLGAVAVGTVLWGIVFFRAGGPGKLIDDPSSIHLNQFGAGYGSLGFGIVLGAFLVALWALLRRPAPPFASWRPRRACSVWSRPSHSRPADR